MPSESQSRKQIKLLGEHTLWCHGAFYYDAVKYRGIIYIDQDTRRKEA